MQTDYAATNVSLAEKMAFHLMKAGATEKLGIPHQ